MSSLSLRVPLLALVIATGASASAAPAEPAAAPAASAPAEPAAPPSAPNDYSQLTNWLCVPGNNAACEANEEATVAAADGKLTVEKFAPAKAPPIDCFYVYPTVSRDPGVISTMNAAPEELSVVAQQFARFGQVCRPFAPLYRQFTLTALRARRAGKPMSTANVDLKIGYRDIVDAWNYYLAHYNKGRGVVLIGHSQGSGVLMPLIKNEIEGKPVQKQLVSAILMGAWLQVPVGRDVGGDFSSVPLCHSASQLGCVITYASFRATEPPPANSLFGKSAGPGLEAACVNPTALAGGSGQAHSYFAVRPGAHNAEPTDWVKGKTVATPFVSVPGLVTAECKKSEVASYLAVSLNGDTAGPRTTEIPGDVVVDGKPQPEWGLHLVDANLFIGNLVSIVRDEAAAYGRVKHR